MLTVVEAKGSESLNGCVDGGTSSRGVLLTVRQSGTASQPYNKHCRSFANDLETVYRISYIVAFRVRFRTLEQNVGKCVRR